MYNLVGKVLNILMDFGSTQNIFWMIRVGRSFEVVLGLRVNSYGVRSSCMCVICVLVHLSSTVMMGY